MEPSAELVELLHDIRESMRELVTTQKAAAEEMARRYRQWEEQYVEYNSESKARREVNETWMRQQAEYEARLETWKRQQVEYEATIAKRRAARPSLLAIAAVVMLGLVIGWLFSLIAPMR